MSSGQDNTHPTVRVRGLTRSYREGDSVHTVIRDAKLQILPGECVALLGRSGSGKSTLLNLIAGIDRPDSGDVVIAGHRISTLKEPALTLFRRRHIGFVYQFFNLIPTLTCAENIALPLELNATYADNRTRYHVGYGDLGGGGDGRVRDRACREGGIFCAAKSP